ncbi:ribbon-helix-helix domain-containing protein [Halobellus ruber]|nr:ribbon-helix-helix domain-containing protein [Halobellus ruber]
MDFANPRSQRDEWGFVRNITDDTWQGRGFNSRSEFVRDTLRDAVELPTVDRDELAAVAPDSGSLFLPPDVFSTAPLRIAALVIRFDIR